MNVQQHFIEPLDVLVLRGNKLFGDPGSFGESVVPPWPSVAAGALRSALLARKGISPSLFAAGAHHDFELGTPEHPGSFVLTAFNLARRWHDSPAQAEPLQPLPADLILCKQDDGRLVAEKLHPHQLHRGIRCSSATPALAVLSEKERRKPETGHWLTVTGWKKHIAGKSIDADADLVRSAELWRVDLRVGVGLERQSRRAADGALFSTEAVALRKAEHQPVTSRRYDIGFLAETVGVEIPDDLPLRFGGDGRVALCRSVSVEPAVPDYDAIAAAGRCRLVLTAPGIFRDGWLPTGATDTNNEITFDLHGVRGRLVCAAVRRAQTVSGFDLARQRPKPAQRVAPIGSVYWLDDVHATPEALRKLVAEGLWSDLPEDASRRAEGFNRLILANY
ncbi:MAG: type III-B CRISPR module-associated protein Cmr3 [Gammaproteobacteria bacterium]|nr:type III-B CRISPR module-associated protein Cmr3 [Gammaproteobacteria bacterium]